MVIIHRCDMLIPHSLSFTLTLSLFNHGQSMGMMCLLLVPCPSPSFFTLQLVRFFRFYTSKKKTAHGARKKNWTWAHTPSSCTHSSILVVVLPSFVLPLHKQTPSHIPCHGMGHRSSATSSSSHCPPIFAPLACLPVTKQPGSDSLRIPYLSYPFWLPCFVNTSTPSRQEKKHATILRL